MFLEKPEWPAMFADPSLIATMTPPEACANGLRSWGVVHMSKSFGMALPDNFGVVMVQVCEQCGAQSATQEALIARADEMGWGSKAAAERERAQGDAVDKLTVLKRLLRFIELPGDAELTDPLDLASALYKRVRLADRIKSVEESGSWDYCKVAAIDFYKGERRWIPIHEAAYDYQLGCVPPAFRNRRLVLTGEPFSGMHHLTLYSSPDGTFWCCQATRREVEIGNILFDLPCARDLPVLGQPEEEEDES